MGTTSLSDIVIFGAGGHSKVVIETCYGTGFRPVVCLGQSRWHALLDVPVEPEAAAADWLSRGVKRAFVAIGNNAVRENVARKAEGFGFELVSIVSRQSHVSPTATLGAGTVVMAGAVVQVEAQIGELAIVNTGASIDHECRLGRAVHVAPHATLCGNVVVGDRAWIGAGATVIEEMQIGHDVFIGAGACVVGHFSEAGTRCAGVPARLIRS